MGLPSGMNLSGLIYLSLLCFSLSLSGCGEADTANEAGTESESDPEGEQEAEILTAYERSCLGCHGAVGEGTAFGYQIQEPVLDYATWVVRNGRTGNAEFVGPMPAFDEGDLSVAELNEILEFLRTQARPETGELLYKRFCGNCHGEMGSGGVVRQSITRDARRDPDGLLNTVRRGEGGNDYADRRNFMPSWSALEISDSEVWKIAQYLGAEGEMPSNWSSPSDSSD